jgi:hypothetical protein
MANAEWIRIQPRDVQSTAVERINGVEVTLMVSPYDIPECIRGDYDEALRRFVIELKYVQKEPWKLERVDEHVSTRVGIKSFRVHGIEIDVDSLEVDAVALQLQLDRAVSESSNATVVQRALKRSLPKLLPGFLAEGRKHSRGGTAHTQ